MGGRATSKPSPAIFKPSSLSSDGVLVLPVLGADVMCIRRQLRAAMASFPEFQKGADRLVLGSFGALGNPASFHHPCVRRCRWRCFEAALGVFRNYVQRFAESESWRLELLWDRLCVRKQGDKMSRETVHRDIAKYKLDSDKIFGGWLNLDCRAQFFHCVPRSHRQNHHGRHGFCREERGNQKMHRVEVEPGGLVVFYQDILHEVPRETVAEDSFRLFVGWRLTQSDRSLQDLAATADPGIPDTDAIFDTQGVPLLPSGQKPPMYAKNHLLFWRKGLVAWSDQSVRDSCKQQTKCGGLKVLLAPRWFGSLQSLGLPLYNEYTDEEKSIMCLAWCISEALGSIPSLGLFIPCEKSTIVGGGSSPQSTNMPAMLTRILALTALLQTLATACNEDCMLQVFSDVDDTFISSGGRIVWS
ncbi:unnamed protein product [Symbiodinium natans]|uniref:Uncharacterized protein n=1 Tax=Symbiodinium natans TaxID=878477 RepID=A0A812U6E5_9DINO|nr:unnamed protein product [Symbiodinium natans]